MEKFYTLHHGTRGEKFVGLVPMGPLIFIHFMKDRNYRIVEVVGQKRKSDTEYYIYEKDKATWVCENHHSELVNLHFELEEQNISSYHFMIEGGIEIFFSYGEFYIYYKKLSDIDQGMRIILKYHGYVAADKIWDYVSRYSAYYDIEQFMLMEPEDITDEMLDLMLASGVKHLEEGRIFCEEMDEDEANKKLNGKLN